MRLARDTVHPEQAAPLSQRTVGPPALGGGIVGIVGDVADGPVPPEDPPPLHPTTAAEYASNARNSLLVICMISSFQVFTV
jgi:hypothetical protein